MCVASGYENGWVGSLGCCMLGLLSGWVLFFSLGLLVGRCFGLSGEVVGHSRGCVYPRACEDSRVDMPVDSVPGFQWG